jgi:plastocyanin
MSRLAAASAMLALPFACAAASIDLDVRNASDAPLADSVVYAIPAAGPIEARPGKATVQIEQVDREFVPYVTVLQTGTTATFPNHDPILHHVYSFSPAKTFEIKLYTGQSPSSVTFDKPGVVTLGCNIHDWMIAYVLVVSTPWFAKTDASGKVRLRDLPPGSYAVYAWHPHMRSPVIPVTVALEGQGSQALGFALDVAPRKAKYKPPLDRLKY